MKIKFNLTATIEYKHASVYLVDEHPQIVVVKATSPYIPKSNFEVIFDELTNVIVEKKIKKVVFDKTALTVFHQPSMEWYFTVWKEKMFHFGLKTHRKILPNDKSFQESAKLGREKLEKMFPLGKFHAMDIKYCSTLAEAIEA